MPTLLQMRIPLTASPSEFEDIVRSALKVRWNSPNLQRFGRNGQSQFGVDISGTDELSRFVGVQCRAQDKMKIKEIEAAAIAAEAFDPKIEAFYLATGLSRDAKLQKAVLLLSERRKKAGKFPVGILFWEDLYEELVTDLIEFAKHYPQFVPPQFLAKASVSSARVVLAEKAAHQQYRAAQEIYSLSHDLTAEMNVRPDLEWQDILEFIAWDFGAREKQIGTMLKTYGLELDGGLKAVLEEAAAICAEGKHTVEMTDDGPQVSQKGMELADRLNDVLSKAADMARDWLKATLKG